MGAATAMSDLATRPVVVAVEKKIRERYLVPVTRLERVLVKCGPYSYRWQWRHVTRYEERLLEKSVFESTQLPPVATLPWNKKAETIVNLDAPASAGLIPQLAGYLVDSRYPESTLRMKREVTDKGLVYNSIEQDRSGFKYAFVIYCDTPRKVIVTVFAAPTAGPTEQTAIKAKETLDIIVSLLTAQ